MCRKIREKASKDNFWQFNGVMDERKEHLTLIVCRLRWKIVSEIEGGAFDIYCFH